MRNPALAASLVGNADYSPPWSRYELRLLYIEAPVMLSAVLQKVISYTPEAMLQGSMWWWIPPLAPAVPERLVVGHEPAFLTWFFDRHTAHRESIEPETVDESARVPRARRCRGRDGASTGRRSLALRRRIP